MKRSLGALVAFAVGTLLVALPCRAAAPGDGESTDIKIAGSWLGTLEAGVKLRVVFHIESAPDGKLAARLDSPDQGAKGIPVSDVTFSDSVLNMAAKAIGGSFSGKLTGDEISGTWKQGGAELPLVLKRVDKIPDLVRPQVPKKPYPYLECEVTFRNEAAGVTLAGTLTLPKVDQPSAAVLLISGSGAGS